MKQDEEPAPEADDYAVELNTGVKIDTETINDDTAEESTADDGDGGNKADIDTSNDDTIGDDYVEVNPVNMTL